MIKKLHTVMGALLLICLSHPVSAQTQNSTMTADCSMMGADMQQFAAQLNAVNKAMFCGKFTDTQRATAMQYGTQQSASGTMMTPDQAVQKVAANSNMTPSQQTPTGCPVK